jgi:hypothetical protein
MAYRKFLTSVADVYAYDSNDNILFTGKTLLDSSIEVSLGSSPVRGGVGNKLQYIYYHTGEMTFNLTDTQWNLQMLGETVGSDYELGNYYAEEEVAVSGGSGTVSGTPIAYDGTTIYGWAEDSSGVVRRVTFTGSTFTTEGDDGDYCVRYYKQNLTEGQQITIKANMIPSVVKLVMETQLNSADVTTNKIGMVQIIAPNVILSGGFTISMTADGIANTPLTGTALASPATSSDACESDEYYAKIVEIIDNTNWYDNIYDLSVSGGAFSLEAAETQTLVIYAISNSGTSFKAPNSGLTFSTSASEVATVGANTGIVTGVTAGSATISMYVTSASSVDSSVVVTVTS